MIFEKQYIIIFLERERRAMNDIIKEALDEYIEVDKQINLDSETARRELANFIDSYIVDYSNKFFKKDLKQKNETK